MKKALLLTLAAIIIFCLVMSSCANIEDGNKGSYENISIDNIGSENDTESESESLPETDEEIISLSDEVYFPHDWKKSVGGFACFAGDVFCADITEMFDKSSVVIRGRVIDDGKQTSGSESSVEAAYSYIRTERVWKGDVKPNDVVEVVQTGWRYDDGSSWSIGGEPILRNNMDVFLFLFDSGYQELYGIMGCFQGIVFVDEAGIAHTYEFFSDEYSDFYFNDVGATIEANEFEKMLEEYSER